MYVILIKAGLKTNNKLYKLAKEMGADTFFLSERQFEDLALGLLMKNIKSNQLLSNDGL